LMLDGYSIVAINTNKKRSLADSAYNERRASCEAGFAILSQEIPGIRCLGDISETQFAAVADKIADPIVKKRVTHVVQENARVLKSVEALQKNDLIMFGKYMCESHESLRDLYEVSCHELDVLVEEALKIEGCIGSRMTGAGFGGCTVSIVRNDALDSFIQQVGENYAKRTEYKADFYVSQIGDGGREITNEAQAI
jgi:galactokinase